MPKFPEPPPADVLAQTPPDVARLPAGSLLWRIYFRAGPHATRWHRFRQYGPIATGRFDPHEPPPRVQERAVLYAALHGPTCFGEVFQDMRTIDRHYREPGLVAFETGEPLELLDLTGTWPTRAGASMALNTGPRPRAQRWARVIHDAYPQLDGIRYASSMDANRPALALFERARSAMPRRPRFHRPLADAPLLALLVDVAARFDYRIV